jgi:hypothetical protein
MPTFVTADAVLGRNAVSIGTGITLEEATAPIASSGLPRMKLFATRVWGFSPWSWPVIVFRNEGDRDNLLQQSNPGDCIVFIATQTEGVDESRRGRLLGIAGIGREPVRTLDIVDPVHIRPHHLNEHGQFKWPFAIRMLRAWQFRRLPKLLDVFHQQLTYPATVRAVLLNEQDTQAALNEPLDEVPVINGVPRPDEHDITRPTTARRATRGPDPIDGTIEMSRSTASDPAFTYAFQFGERNLFKIGWSQNLRQRLSQMNYHVPTEILEESWRFALLQAMRSGVEAHAFEQRILDQLKPYRTTGERVQCSEHQLRNAWACALKAGAETD